MTRFATAEDLGLYLTGETPSTPDDDEWIAQAEMILDLVSDDIRSAARSEITKQGSDPHEVTAKLAGTWSRDLELPGGPITSVVSVKVNGIAVGFTWNERSTLRIGEGTLPTVFTADEEGPDGRIGQGAQGGPEHDSSVGNWGGPTSTVEVVYVPGYDAAEVPGWVRSMAIRVAARTIGNPTTLTQETLGPYSASYGNTLDAGGSHLTDKETKLLRRKFSRTAGTAGTRGR